MRKVADEQRVKEQTKIEDREKIETIVKQKKENEDNDIMKKNMLKGQMLAYNRQLGDLKKANNEVKSLK